MCTNEQQSVHADSPSGQKGKRKEALHENEALNVDAYRTNRRGRNKQQASEVWTMCIPLMFPSEAPVQFAQIHPIPTRPAPLLKPLSLGRHYINSSRQSLLSKCSRPTRVNKGLAGGGRPRRVTAEPWPRIKRILDPF